ncbi:MAG: cytochrome c oxidase assembly protein [Streptosporangiaceae bacterium]
MEANQTGHPDAVPRRPRRWLAAVAAVLIVASLLPPADALERRYLFAESIQFCVFALAAPALAVLGAPLSMARGGAGRLRRLAEARRRRPSFTAASGYLIAWVVICVAWRLPPVLDGLARHPVLAVPEAVTLCTAGTGLWLELAGSPPLAPRLPRPQRAAVAALAMWSIWVTAYILGFARDSVVHAYDGAGSHLVTVADQGITAFVLWAAAAVAFLPAVFTIALGWLKDGSEPAAEGPELPAGGSEPAAEPADGAPGTPVRPVGRVRGWGPPARGRRRTPA